MPTVGVNPPKTPVTKGSNGIATATLPNICKMPGPPAPFVPVPLPNIGMSGLQPSGYSQSVTIEGFAVAIRGASFGSIGDIASQGTGGGIISSNVQGPTTFLGLGSLDVQIEGKNVQLLSDPMLNNCGPGGSPPNAATMAGVLQPGIAKQAADLGVLAEIQAMCDVLCKCIEAGTPRETCVAKALKAADVALGGKSPIKAEAPYNMQTDPPTPMAYPGQARPDAVILKDPTKPATQQNLAAVVEVKIGDDDWHDGQEEDYQKIAGDPKKVILLTTTNCQCTADPEPQPAPVVVKKPEQLPLPFQAWPDTPLGQAVAVILILAFAPMIIGELGGILAF